MDRKPIAGAVVALIGLIGGDTWIVTRLLETYQKRQEADMAALNARLNLMVTEYVIPANKQLAEVRAQMAVERVLRICAERPEVCEE